ncbi:MAG: DUF348 domain-containing protein [Chloroflexi bacterium]|nr:DUF348 domain-containing protein [Chloroflexota bacterium]
MRLYHSILLLFLAFVLTMSACALIPTEQPMIQVQIAGDGQIFTVQAPPQGTVQDALEIAGLSLEALDRIEPDLHVSLVEGMEITLTRVYEEFEVEQVVIPYEQQLLPVETLPEGARQPSQPGENGLMEITYRIVYEDGVEVSKTEIRTVMIKEPQPQVMLVGVQTSFTPRPIPGRLVYLSDGNAWMMEGTTANRIPLVSTGDLDGRVFVLSDDAEWLLFTRHADDEQIINTLWVVQIDNPDVEIDLQATNVIHFADWQPGTTAYAAYSTVEPRQAAPGWQANNDVQMANFSVNGWVDPSPEVVVETNSGGVYGWWGTDFVYGANARSMAYANPNEIGLVDLEEGILTPVLENTPLETRGDWAWVPGLEFGPDGAMLFTVRHAPPAGSASPEESPKFDLTAIPLAGGMPVDLVSHVGMFAYPLPSPMQPKTTGEQAYQVAFLQAIFPDQSDDSRYRVMIMDRDGSNRRELFPSSEAQGIEPQRDWGAWAPQLLEGSDGYLLAVLYQGNIWLVDSATGEAWQISGDGRINRLDWR